LSNRIESNEVCVFLMLSFTNLHSLLLERSREINNDSYYLEDGVDGLEEIIY